MRRSLQLKKIIANPPLCVLLCAATAYKQQLCTARDQHKANIEIVVNVYLLGWIQRSLKITEDILHKIYTEKSPITDIWLVLSTAEVRKEFSYMFPSGNKSADAKKEVASYMGA